MSIYSEENKWRSEKSTAPAKSSFVEEMLLLLVQQTKSLKITPFLRCYKLKQFQNFEC
jgi:hypothetical protein